MELKIVREGSFEDLPIKEGDIFLLPPSMPHSPQRFENTIGLVIEQKRSQTGILIKGVCDRITVMRVWNDTLIFFVMYYYFYLFIFEYCYISIG